MEPNRRALLVALLAGFFWATLGVLTPLPACPSGTEEIYFTDFTDTNNTFDVGEIRQASSTDEGNTRVAYGAQLWGPVQSGREAEPPLAIALPNVPELSSYHWKADVLFHESWDGCNDDRDTNPESPFFAEWVRVFEGPEGAPTLRHYTSISTSLTQVKCWPLQQSPDDRRLCLGGEPTLSTESSPGSYYVNALTRTNSAHFSGDNAFGHFPGPWELKVASENNQGYLNGGETADEPFSFGQIRLCGVFGTATVPTDATADDDSPGETSITEEESSWVIEPGFLFGAIAGLAVVTGLVLGYSRSRIDSSSDVVKSEAPLMKKSGASDGAGLIVKKDSKAKTPGVLAKSSKRRDSKGGRKNSAGSRGRTNSAGSRGRTNSAGSRGRAGSASSTGRRGSGGSGGRRRASKASSGGTRASRLSGGMRSSGATSVSGVSGGTRTSTATNTSGISYFSGASKASGASGASGVSKASGFTARTGVSSIAPRIRRNPDGTLIEDFS